MTEPVFQNQSYGSKTYLLKTLIKHNLPPPVYFFDAQISIFSAACWIN